jgi:hypothetical protein
MRTDAGGPQAQPSRPRSRGDGQVLLDPFDPQLLNDLRPAGDVALICDQWICGMSLMGLGCVKTQRRCDDVE